MCNLIDRRRPRAPADGGASDHPDWVSFNGPRACLIKIDLTIDQGLFTPGGFTACLLGVGHPGLKATFVLSEMY